jgi:hypothetical protein
MERGPAFPRIGRLPVSQFCQPNLAQLALLTLTLLLLTGSFWINTPPARVEAAGCRWHRIRHGDTLSGIAARYQISMNMLITANGIRNPNRIYSGRTLCIPQKTSTANSGLSANGIVKWHAYDALERSSQQGVNALLKQAAKRYHLPLNLLQAIAWQESGWTQYVIARDGGIGVMQIMPYTAQSLNQIAHQRYDPYKLHDNIELGAFYLKTLWGTFQGNITRIISAYNQGAWSVIHRGIFNWPYVESVKALMRRYG